MSFKIAHSTVKNVAALGKLAGEAKATVRNQQIAAQMAAQIRAEANRKELAVFQAMLGVEKQKRDMAWEMEKIDLYQRNKFDMALALDNVGTQKQHQDQEQKKDKLNLILDNLRSNDTITENERERFAANARADIYGIQAGVSRTAPRDNGGDILSMLKRGMADQAGQGDQATPTEAQLRKVGTKAAYDKGARLGYWR